MSSHESGVPASMSTEARRIRTRFSSRTVNRVPGANGTQLRAVQGLTSRMGSNRTVIDGREAGLHALRQGRCTVPSEASASPAPPPLPETSMDREKFRPRRAVSVKRLYRMEPPSATLATRRQVRGCAQTIQPGAPQIRHVRDGAKGPVFEDTPDTHWAISGEPPVPPAEQATPIASSISPTEAIPVLMIRGFPVDIFGPHIRPVHRPEVRKPAPSKLRSDAASSAFPRLSASIRRLTNEGLRNLADPRRSPFLAAFV
jgi:hypothetical protein